LGVRDVEDVGDLGDVVDARWCPRFFVFLLGLQSIYVDVIYATLDINRKRYFIAFLTPILFTERELRTDIKAAS
jgi:hypothetical protein